MARARRPAATAGPVAFVLSGGGSLGAVQVGQLRALAERGISADLIVGASVGSVNGVHAAAEPGLVGVDDLERLWLETTSSQAFPPAPLDALLAVVGLRNALTTSDPLRRRLEGVLGSRRLEQLPVPAHCVTTDVLNGRTVVLSRGSAVDAVMASSAIPGVYPPVTVGRHTLMDGGFSENTPVGEAIARAARRIYVLPTGFACSVTDPPRSALGMVVHALSVLAEQRLINELGQYQEQADITVLPPPCPMAVFPLDFSHTATLIATGHRLAARALDGAGPGVSPAAVLAMRHRHRRPLGQRSA